MKTTEYPETKQDVISKYGPWTAHNIHLGGGEYTMRDRLVGDELKLRRVLQVVADSSKKPLHELRVLDLACLEGLYAIEFAMHGADVVGIEGREANIEKARFAQRALALRNLEFIQDDVRNLSVEKYGKFDVVLCLGILYHLDEPDVFMFLENIARVCTGLTVIHTHLGPHGRKCTYGGKAYYGQDFVEHKVQDAETKKKALWASLDNNNSFWPTRASLYNALLNFGFTSVSECHIPHEPQRHADRVTLIANRGAQQEILSSPLVVGTPHAEERRQLPERILPKYLMRRTRRFWFRP